MEPGPQLTDFTIFVFTVFLITPMSVLSLLFSTRLVEYIDSTRFLLSTNARIGKSKLFTFNNSFNRARCWIASSNPSHRLRASAPKVDLTARFILFECYVNKQQLSLESTRNITYSPTLLTPSLRLAYDASVYPTILHDSDWQSFG